MPLSWGIVAGKDWIMKYNEIEHELFRLSTSNQHIKTMVFMRQSQGMRERETMIRTLYDLVEENESLLNELALLNESTKPLAPAA